MTNKNIEGIFSLWNETFGDLLEKNDIFKIDQKWWDWRVLKNPEGHPKIYLDFSKSGEIMAHHMIEKFKLNSKKEEKPIYQGILTMAKKGKGFSILKLLSESVKDVKAENVLECGFPNDEANKIYEKLGWKTVGEVPVLGRPLNLLFKVFDVFINKTEEYKIKKIEKFDNRINNFTDSIKKMFRYSIKRDDKTLNWKYVDNPLKQYEKRLLLKSDEVKGYCVFRCAKFNKIKTGIILDIFADDEKGLNVLLDEVIKYFIIKKMRFISCYMINNNFYYKGLLRRGFFRLPTFLLPKKNVFHIINNEEEDILNIKNWYLSYGDWDCV